MEKLLGKFAALSIITIGRGPECLNHSVVSTMFGNTSNNEAINHEDPELTILVDLLLVIRKFPLFFIFPLLR